MTNTTKDARFFDLQFFAEELESTSDADTVNSEVESGATNDVEPEESFIDNPELLPEELRNSEAYKMMNKGFTRKMQEIATYRNSCRAANITPELGAELIRRMNDDPEKFIADFASEKGYKLSKAEQAEETKAEPEIEDLGDDEYAREICRSVTAQIEKELSKKYAPLLERHERERQVEAQKFLAEVNNSIDQTLKDYEGCGVTKEQLFEAARRNQILPGDMDVALRALLGPAKFRELEKQKLLKEISNKAAENRTSVSSTLGDGTAAERAVDKPASLDDVRENILARLASRTS